MHWMLSRGTNRAQSVILQARLSRLPSSRGGAALAIVVFGFLAAQASASSGRLVVATAALRSFGLTATSVSADAARADLDGGLTRAERRVLGRASVQVSGASGGGERLLSAAFELGSSRAAHRLLLLWRKRVKASTVSVGMDGGVLVRGGVVSVAWREGALVGILVLAAAHAEEQRALELARLGDDSLREGPALTALARISEQFGPEGQVPLHAALQELALEGPLPGVRVPAGTRPRLLDGTGIEFPILQYLPRLHGRLRKAVLARLGIDRASVHGARAAKYGDPDFTLNAELKAIADKWVADYEEPGLLGVPLDETIVAGISDNVQAPAEADSYPINASGAYEPVGAPICRIRYRTAAFENQNTPEIEYAIAHEVFHCFEFALDPSWPHQGGWLIEGMAEWGADEIDPAAPRYDSTFWQKDYLSEPCLPLYDRTYDAVGYWGHVQETVPGGLWPRVKEVLNAPHALPAIVDAGGETPAFQETWGSGFFRVGPTADAAWNIVKPRVVSTSELVAQTEVIDENQVINARQLATAQYSIEPSASPEKPIVHVVMNSGQARLEPNFDYTHVTNGYFCPGSAESCVCPPNTGPPVSVKPISADADLALSSGYTALAEGSVSYLTLKEFCKPLLSPRSCMGLIPTTDFMPQYLGEPFDVGEAVERLDPTVANKCDYNGSEADPFCGEEGCHYATYGSVLLTTAPSEESAQQIYDNFTVGVPGVAALAGVGNEAAVDTTDGAGYMRLENDFVFVTGFAPPSNLLDAQQALSTIEGELLG
jgi:hypothetical protein